MRKPVIITARDGYGINDDVQYHTLDSRYNQLKIKEEAYGTASVVTQVDWQLDIVHNLGYKPFVLFYFQHPNDSRWYLAPAKVDSSWTLNGVYKHIDNDTVRIKLYDNLTGLGEMPSSPTNVNYKYFIFIDPRKDAWS